VAQKGESSEKPQKSMKNLNKKKVSQAILEKIMSYLRPFCWAKRRIKMKKI
jgi:hypothetical protein